LLKENIEENNSGAKSKTKSFFSQQGLLTRKTSNPVNKNIKEPKEDSAKKYFLSNNNLPVAKISFGNLNAIYSEEIKEIEIPAFEVSNKEPRESKEDLDICRKKTGRNSEKDTNVGSRYNPDSDESDSEISLIQQTKHEYSTLSAVSISEVSDEQSSVLSKVSQESEYSIKKNVKNTKKKNIKGAILSKAKELSLYKPHKCLWDS